MLVYALTAAAPAATGVAAEQIGVDIAAAGEFSVVTMFMQADPVVKGVMIILAVASVWSWAIIFDKWFQFGGLKRRAKSIQELFSSTNWSMNGLRERLRQFPRKDPHIEIHDSVVDEYQRLTEAGRTPRNADSLAERIERKASASVVSSLSRVENGLGVLASVASASPFIGLFGTVWGIMNSFRAIASEQNTNLAVVAPGIAEALFATALGLLAAIPAVIFFNKYSTDLGRYQTELEGYADELAADLSRRATDRSA